MTTWRLTPSRRLSSFELLLSSISIISIAVEFCVLVLAYSSNSGEVSLFCFLV